MHQHDVIVFQVNARRVLVFTRPCDFTQYSVSILKVWWEIFPTFNVAKCEATVAKVSQNSADYY